MRIVCDTCILSYVIRGDTRVALYKDHLDGAELCLAFITIAELYRWKFVHQLGKVRSLALDTLIHDCVSIPHDDQTSMIWAEITSQKGRPRSPMDAWVAATAIRHGIPLVTHNRKHFEGIPHLNIISESD